ncbi:MAG: acetyl-CoA carboxylase biotin carboxyl carrier protein [Fibrobacterota bacterium]
MAAKKKPQESAKDIDGLFSLEQIKDFIKFVEKVDISEVTVTVKDRTLVVSKRPRAGAVSQVTYAEAPGAPAPRTAAPAPTAAPSPAPAARPANLKEIVSPIVGTFYRATDPKAKPFVQPGDTVAVNQTVCIIEAMKIFNEIKSEVNGVIKEICVENEQPVEFGQPLFLVETK